MIRGISLAVTVALRESFVGCEQAGDADCAARGVAAGHWVSGVAAGGAAGGGDTGCSAWKAEARMRLMMG